MKDKKLIYLEDDQWKLTYAGCKPAIQINVDDIKLIINLEQVRDLYKSVMTKEIKTIFEQIGSNKTHLT